MTSVDWRDVVWWHSAAWHSFRSDFCVARLPLPVGVGGGGVAISGQRLKRHTVHTLQTKAEDKTSR